MPVLSRVALSLFFVGAGIAHFLVPAPYVAIVPPVVPWPKAVVAISGGAEILGGLGICLPLTRMIAGWGLIALLVAVFPANIYAATNGMSVDGKVVPEWIMWARLPLQALFIVWVWSACFRRSRRLAAIR